LVANGWLEVDGDLAKEKIPEYMGGVGANAVHEEASGISNRVLERAIANGELAKDILAGKMRCSGVIAWSPAGAAMGYSSMRSMLRLQDID
jgi:hypothetical protein